MDSNKSPSNKFHEFHPKSKWVHAEDHSIIQVELPEFKKEELKVQIDRMGNLRISGMHQMDGSLPIRFSESHRVPENSKHDRILAKFERGVLSINIPLGKPEGRQTGHGEGHQPPRRDQTESDQGTEATLPAAEKEKDRSNRLEDGSANLRLKTSEGHMMWVIVGVLVVAALVGFLLMTYRLAESEVDGNLLDFLDWENY